MLAYVAHPIDQAAQSEWLDHHKMLVGMKLREMDVAAYWPSKSWQLNSVAMAWDQLRDTIGVVNCHAQAGAAITVAILPDGVTTLGVPSEIERALQWGQPVVIVAGDTTQRTVQYTEWLREGAFAAGDERLIAPMLYRAMESFKEAPPFDPPKPNEISVKLDHDTAWLPTRTYRGDAGFDLHLGEEVTLAPGEYVDIQCGISISMPPGVWGWLTPRSSTARRGLLVNQAVIDQGYTGPMFVGVTNISAQPVHVAVGERIAQLIPMPLLAADMGVRVVESFPETDRGSNGFGSTGR